MRTIIPCWIGASLGNFVYQAFNNHEYAVALERSFFQGALVLIIVVAMIIGNLELRERE